MSNPDSSWRAAISEEMVSRGETWADVVAHTMSEKQLSGQRKGFEYSCGFTLWTKMRVYFPTCYDGEQFVNSVPRNPCDEVTEHVGGG